MRENFCRFEMYVVPMYRKCKQNRSIKCSFLLSFLLICLNLLSYAMFSLATSKLVFFLYNYILRYLYHTSFAVAITVCKHPPITSSTTTKEIVL